MEDRQALSGGLRLFVGGGLPPPSHEELRVAPDGTASYVTGMPWPAQPPFDEIGAYRADVVGDTLSVAARRVLAAAPRPVGSADLGLEAVALEGAQAHWSPDARPDGAPELIAAARRVIGAAREHPWAAVRGRVRAGAIELTGRGEQPLEVRDAEVRAGWGAPAAPPSPLDLAARPPAAVALPPALAPGATVVVALPDPGPAVPDGRIFALVHLRFRVPATDDWVDGWLTA